MKQTKPESPYIGLGDAALELGVSKDRLAKTTTLPDGSLGCKYFPELRRLQDAPPAAGVRGTKILFVREQVLALAEKRRQPPQAMIERTSQPIAFSEEQARMLLAMGPAGARVLRMKL